MRSGYVEESSKKSNRPPLAGFFVEDFTYVKVKDEDVLDENNGRFCVTPDFPNERMHFLQLSILQRQNCLVLL